VEIELFFIGLPRARAFHIIEILSYEFDNDFTHYSDISNYVKFLIDYEYKLNYDFIESKEIQSFKK
jgi:hypothetical protein